MGNRLCWLALAGLIAVGALAGCGGSSGTSATTVGPSAGVTVPERAPSTGCGSFTAPAAKDPDGVLATLPDAQRDAYAGFPVVRKSAAWPARRPTTRKARGSRRC